MNKWAFIAFAVLMWLLPALLAGALGWSGIWGGGSAFSDLIIPAPITGGIFHVPSFVIALAIVKAYPTFTEQSAAVARAVLMSAVVLGLLQLIDLERLVQVITTDVGGRLFRMEQSYVGLCMASDAIVALSWVMRRPLEKQGWMMTSLFILVPAAMYVGSDAAGLDRLKEPFQFGRQAYTETRGDAVVWVYTRLDPSTRSFRESALDFVEQFRPEQRSDTDDLAIYFTNSLQTARTGAEGHPVATLCLYEDGTPDGWYEGAGDCFTGHESFTEQFQARSTQLFAVLPTDVSVYVMFNEFCQGIEIPSGYSGGVAHFDFCRGQNADKKRAELEKVYGAEELDKLLEKP